MNVMRKFLCFLMATTIAAFALPGMAAKPQQAPEKSYSVEFLLPPTAPDGTANPSYTTGTDGQTVLNLPVTVTVYVKNESPPSTAASNASSLKFQLSGLVPVGVACPRANCTIDTTTNTVYVMNISQPIQAKEVYPVTLQVNSCVVLGEATIGDVHVYTGSQFNGGEFMPHAGDTLFPIKQTLSTRTPFDFTQAATIATTGISCGNAACGLEVSVPNILGDPAQTSVMTIARGHNADGSCSPTSFIDYFVTNSLWSSNTSDPLSRRLHAAWSGGTVSPVFAYKLTRATTTAGWEVGWLPKPGIAVTVPAPACAVTFMPSDEPTVGELPFPEFLGVLSGDLKMNGDKIKVDTLGNPPPTITGGGLPIRIDNEWMLVTAVGSNTWDVTRNAPTFHPAGSTVATTPMQLLSGLTSPLTNTYSNNTPAQMCMVWQSSDGATAWFMDGSDGWVLGK
jgi:hypothetical protein